MAESIVQINEGTGKKLHTFQRTIGANNVEDEVVILGDAYNATYMITTGLTSFTTANGHLLQIMAGASLKVYIRKIIITQSTAATTAGLVRIALYRLTSAGTGGGVQTVNPMDSSDAAAGCTAMTLPTAKGTEGALMWLQTCNTIQTVPVGGPGQASVLYTWDQDEFGKALIIPAGATNGIAIKQITAQAAATVEIGVILTEQNY